MSNHGSRFDREFTPDDLAIVNMGYWDPNADEDSEQADSAPVEAESSKPAEADAEPAEHEVAATPLSTEIAEEAEAAETVEDSDSSEESQETAPRESKKPEAKPVKIPEGGPSTAPSVAVDAEAEFSKVEVIPGGVKSAIEAILAVAEAPVSVKELSAALIVSERAVEHALDQLYSEYNGEESGYGEDENRVALRPRRLRPLGGTLRDPFQERDAEQARLRDTCRDCLPAAGDQGEGGLHSRRECGRSNPSATPTAADS